MPEDITPEYRAECAYGSVRTLLTLARPPKVSDDWEPSIERIIDFTRASCNIDISEEEAAAGLERLLAESREYVAAHPELFGARDMAEATR